MANEKFEMENQIPCCDSMFASSSRWRHRQAGATDERPRFVLQCGTLKKENAGADLGKNGTTI
jgi:hypothetical protein